MKKMIYFVMIIILCIGLFSLFSYSQRYLKIHQAAYQYAHQQHFSKEKIYQLLTSPHVHNFSKATSKKVVENLKVNYKKSALIQGQHVFNHLFYSKKKIFHFLTDEDREQFSLEEGTYALFHLPDNYQENALHQMYFYLDQGYSLGEIKEILEDPQQGGFTKEEVLYALHHY